MVLDVEPPDPPDLSNRGIPEELVTEGTVSDASALRRDELETVLHSGAWQEAFKEWAEYTDLDEAEFRILRDAGLFQELDLYWDPIDERLRAEAPRVTDAVRANLAEVTTDVGPLVSTVERELSDLGETVVELIVDAYIDLGADGSEDFVWSEETFGHGIQE